MNLKICCNGHQVTTKNAVKVSRNDWGLWFNCPDCSTTLFIRTPKDGNCAGDKCHANICPESEQYEKMLKEGKIK